MKLLSVAVPSYNSANYLEKCIHSLAIAGSEIEILIVDDGSSDTTWELAQQLERQYPDCVRAIHQENKGHGGAVNTGLAHATGAYFKVVDSDDWVEAQALLTVMQTLRHFEQENQLVDLLFTNYVNEIDGVGAKVMSYRQLLPINQMFSWDEVNPFPAGKYLMMHALIYRTQLLRECKLQLPEHTFYVDNLYVYEPLRFAKKMYYLDVDFYRYFIGRNDQSVNEKVMMKRIDQQLKVNYLLIDAVDFEAELHPAVRQYLWQHLEIVMGISSAILNKMGTPTDLEKRKALWDYLKANNPSIYEAMRFGLFGRLVNPSTKSGLWASNKIYRLIRKLGGY
ncbi:MAG: glycosyltransferase family 2 protein [Aerococcaceae bacterium]|nr:glycosyltransferase family 2 protein [Aerococcaceae bacterium]